MFISQTKVWKCTEETLSLFNREDPVQSQNSHAGIFLPHIDEVLSLNFWLNIFPGSFTQFRYAKGYDLFTWNSLLFT